MVGLLLTGSLRAAPLPEVGVPVPELAVFDTLMQGFMATNDIPAGALGIMKDGVVIFDRAYGHEDAARTRPVRPDTRMRVASLTKPVTAAAIRALVDAGSIELTNQVFSLGVPGAGILDYVPFGSNDVRLADVTIGRCLHHRGGWDRDAVGDITYMERTVASDMGVPNPPGRENTVRWIMGQPLQFDPGSSNAYSNVGFLLLGLIVEQVSGMDYLDYVHSTVFAGTGITSNDLFLGRTFQEDQDPREPYYHAPTIAWNVFYPDAHPDIFVPWAYGSWDHEARTGQGRVVASTRAYLEYLDRYVISGWDIGDPRYAPGTWKRNHTGQLSGTDTLARQRGDGINYVVLFNKNPLTGSSYASQMRTAIDGLIETGVITNWPSVDPASLAMPSPTLAMASNALSAVTAEGRYYQLEVSTNLVDWSFSTMMPWVGDGSAQAIPYSFSGTNEVEYLRISVK